MAKKGQPALAAMEGYGFYNRNSSVQAAGIGKCCHGGRKRPVPSWSGMSPL